MKKLSLFYILFFALIKSQFLMASEYSINFRTISKEEMKRRYECVQGTESVPYRYAGSIQHIIQPGEYGSFEIGSDGNLYNSKTLTDPELEENAISILAENFENRRKLAMQEYCKKRVSSLSKNLSSKTNRSYTFGKYASNSTKIALLIKTREGLSQGKSRGQIVLEFMDEHHIDKDLFNSVKRFAQFYTLEGNTIRNKYYKYR